MSTRSQIAIYGNENAPILSAKVSLYRHSDGMPESVLPEIKPFLSEFNKARGIDDAAYCLARLTQHLTNAQNKYQREMVERDGFKLDKESFFLGYGIMSELAGDIEYFYHVSPTAIKVYSVAGKNPDFWKMIKRVNLGLKREPSVML